MTDKDMLLAEKIADWASFKYGPYADSHKKNIAVMLAKSGVDLKKLDALKPREKMHDINIITVSQTFHGLFSPMKKCRKA